MTWLLAQLATLVRDRPRTVLLAIAALTVSLGAFASQQEADTELTAFAPDSPAALALDRARSEFGGGGETLQIIIDAGPGGDVWSRAGLDLAVTVETAINDALAGDEAIVATGATVGPVLSFAQPVLGALDAEGISLTAATEEQIDAAALTALAQGAGQFASQDSGDGRAEAGLVIVAFPPDLDLADINDISLALADAVDGLGTDDIAVGAFNAAVMSQALLEESQAEMPLLFGLSLAIILGILLFQFRRVSDVAIALVGMLVSIVWMTGFAVILGPKYLGVVGPFSQIAMIVPVLLVSLGIDYSIHLTTRYREERSHGLAPNRAGAMAVRTVGGALVLATLTTIVGFLTNVVSPLPPIADFGIFTAIGVICAFVILTAMVPAIRNIADTRRLARGRDIAAPRAAEGLGALIGRVAILSQRAPRVVLGVALVLSVAATGAASQVSTSFSQDDFIPADSAIGRMLDRTMELFAGDVNETTFVMVDGDFTDPAIMNAVADLTDALAGLDHVRTTNGSAQITSPVSAIATTAELAPERADEFAALGYTPTTGLDADADMAGLLAVAAEVNPALVGGVVSADRATGLIAIGTSAGQDHAKSLAEKLDAELVGLRAAGAQVVVTSEPLVIDESLDALTASQTRGIVITLAAALVLLVGYYGVADRKPVLGLITMVSSVAVVAWVLGTMWLMGISFNVMTAMVASLGIGIGVPFGIHITHRFLEDRRRYETVDEAIYRTVRHTGGAMAGTAATTAGGFGVLIFASLVPIQQFGMIVAITITYSFFAAVIIQPSCLKLWAEYRALRGDRGELLEHERRDGTDTAEPLVEAAPQPEPVS